MDVVSAATGVDVGHFLAGDPDRRLPADVARGQTVPASCCHIGLYLDVRHVGLEGGVGVDDPLDVGDSLLDLLGLDLQRGQIRSVDPDHHRLAGSGEYLLDAFAQVGLDVAIQARVAV